MIRTEIGDPEMVDHGDGHQQSLQRVTVEFDAASECSSEILIEVLQFLNERLTRTSRASLNSPFTSNDPRVFRQ